MQEQHRFQETIPRGQSPPLGLAFRQRPAEAYTGILTARLQSDPLLSAFRTVVLDEFHERHLDTDLALAALEQAVAKGHSTVLLKSEPLLSGLRGNPRFVRITKADNRRK